MSEKTDEGQVEGPGNDSQRILNVLLDVCGQTYLPNAERAKVVLYF